MVHLEPRAPTIEPVDVQADPIEEKPIAHLVPRAATIEPVDVQADPVPEKPVVHLEPRAPTIEPVDVQADSSQLASSAPLVTRLATIESLEKTKQDATVPKPTVMLHGAPVDLPEIELVKPGPLPVLSIPKDKVKKSKEPITTDKPVKLRKSTGGLCASCFGSKAAEKKRKETSAEPTKAPIEKKVDLPITESIATPTIEAVPIPILPLAIDGAFIVPDTDIDQYKERTFDKVSEVNVERERERERNDEPIVFSRLESVQTRRSSRCHDRETSTDGRTSLSTTIGRACAASSRRKRILIAGDQHVRCSPFTSNS